MSKKSKARHDAYVKQRKKELEQPTVSIPSTYSSYYLFNPAFDISLVLKLLGNRAYERMIIRGKPEDFTENPNEVFRVVNQSVHLTQDTTDHIQTLINTEGGMP